MTRLTETIVAFAGIAVIIIGAVYFANHVDCAKIPLLGSACVISK